MSKPCAESDPKIMRLDNENPPGFKIVFNPLNEIVQILNMREGVPGVKQGVPSLTKEVELCFA
jgi:hypothetical protein